MGLCVSRERRASRGKAESQAGEAARLPEVLWADAAVPRRGTALEALAIEEASRARDGGGALCCRAQRTAAVVAIEFRKRKRASSR